MSMCRVFSCVIGRGCLLWPVHFLGKTLLVCPASFCTPRPNLPVTLGVSWLPTFAFESPRMKRTSFLGVSSKRSCSVQFSRSVMSDALRPHESQHARPPCPSSSPAVHSDSRPTSTSFHPAILSSVIPFSSCPQSLPPSESFPMSQLFAWGGQSTGVSALASFLPRKSQGWSPSEWTGWIFFFFKLPGIY